MTDAEKAYQYFVTAVPENEEQAKVYFWARKALLASVTQPNEMMTEEQLQEMVGHPAWIESARRKEWMLLWGYHGPEVYGRAFIFTRRTGQKEQFPFSELGVTWWPYRRPPEGEA